MLDTYKIAVENLLGLHSLTVVANKAVLSVKANSIDVIKLLPTHEQLQAAIKHAAGDEEGSDASGGDDDDKEEKEAVEVDKVLYIKGRAFFCFVFPMRGACPCISLVLCLEHRLLTRSRRTGVG